MRSRRRNSTVARTRTRHAIMAIIIPAMAPADKLLEVVRVAGEGSEAVALPEMLAPNRRASPVVRKPVAGVVSVAPPV